MTVYSVDIGRLDIFIVSWDISALPQPLGNLFSSVSETFYAFFAYSSVGIALILHFVEQFTFYESTYFNKRVYLIN